MRVLSLTTNKLQSASWQRNYSVHPLFTETICHSIGTSHMLWTKLKGRSSELDLPNMKVELPRAFVWRKPTKKHQNSRSPQWGFLWVIVTKLLTASKMSRTLSSLGSKLPTCLENINNTSPLLLQRTLLMAAKPGLPVTASSRILQDSRYHKAEEINVRCLSSNKGRVVFTLPNCGKCCL